VVSSCLAATLTGAGSADEADLVTTVRAAHRSARESIRSLAATVTYEQTFPKKELVATAKYWRSLGVVRVHEPVDAGSNDYLLKDGEIRQVGYSGDRRGGPRSYVATRRPKTTTLCMCDPWTLMLIDFPGPNGGRYDYDHVLELAKRPAQAVRERRGGRDYVRVTITSDMVSGAEVTTALWHDVGYNYLVSRMEVIFSSSSDRGVAEIMEFTDFGQGVFVPTKYRRQMFHREKLVSGEDVTLSDVRVNEPIPKSVFQLPAIPAGTVLRNEFAGTRYPVNSGWQRIGAAETLPHAFVAGKLPGEPVENRGQSTHEPRSWSLWLAPAPLVVLAVAGACLLYRRYRLQQ
jgi:hypothetical protein